MKLPPDFDLRSDLHLMIWKPRGMLNEKVVNRIIAFIRDEEAKSDANERRFIDTRHLTAVDLNFRYVFHVALYRRMSRMGGSEIKSAFLVKDPGFAHYFKLHQMLTDHSPLKVRLFEDVQSAADWLELPWETLQIAAAQT